METLSELYSLRRIKQNKSKVYINAYGYDYKITLKEGDYIIEHAESTKDLFFDTWNPICNKKYVCVIANLNMDIYLKIGYNDTIFHNGYISLLTLQRDILSGYEVMVEIGEKRKIINSVFECIDNSFVFE